MEYYNQHNKPAQFTEASNYIAGFWAHDNKVYDVSTGIHARFIVDNPELFGLTLPEIEKAYADNGERLGQEGKTREDLIKKVAQNGWVRVRHYLKPKDYWSIQADSTKRRESTIKNFINWAIDNKQMTYTDEAVILGYNDPNDIQRYTYMEGGIKNYIMDTEDLSFGESNVMLSVSRMVENAIGGNKIIEALSAEKYHYLVSYNPDMTLQDNYKAFNLLVSSIKEMHIPFLKVIEKGPHIEDSIFGAYVRYIPSTMPEQEFNGKIRVLKDSLGVSERAFNEKCSINVYSTSMNGFLLGTKQGIDLEEEKLIVKLSKESKQLREDVAKLYEHASLSRVMQHANSGFIVVSAFNGDNTFEQNYQNHQSMKQDLKNLRLGYFELIGAWDQKWFDRTMSQSAVQEAESRSKMKADIDIGSDLHAIGDDTHSGDPETEIELSFFIPYNSKVMSYRDLVETGIKLGNKYHQYAMDYLDPKTKHIIMVACADPSEKSDLGVLTPSALSYAYSRIRKEPRRMFVFK